MKAPNIRKHKMSVQLRLLVGPSSSSFSFCTSSAFEIGGAKNYLKIISAEWNKSMWILTDEFAPQHVIMKVVLVENPVKSSSCVGVVHFSQYNTLINTPLLDPNLNFKVAFLLSKFLLVQGDNNLRRTHKQVSKFWHAQREWLSHE